jgi:hypothetical protein
MKRLILIVSFYSLPIFSFCQSAKVFTCDCELPLNWKYVKTSTTESNTINTPFGKIHNTDGCEIQKILEDSADYFQVIPFFGSKENQKAPMWINKKDYFVVHIPNYFQKHSRVYIQPDSNSALIIEIQEKQINKDLELVILGCRKDWLQITFMLNNRKYTGWIRKQETCLAPCSSCEE